MPVLNVKPRESVNFQLFKSFGVTLLRIELRFTDYETDTLTTRPRANYIDIHYIVNQSFF